MNIIPFIHHSEFSARLKTGEPTKICVPLGNGEWHWFDTISGYDTRSGLVNDYYAERAIHDKKWLDLDTGIVYDEDPSC